MDGKPLYENSSEFLRVTSADGDPFGQEFEKSLEDAPIVDAFGDRLLRQCSASSSNSFGANSSSGGSAPHFTKKHPAPFAAPPKRQSAPATFSKRRVSSSGYDAMTINSGRPVIVTPTSENSLTSVNFGSPLRDVQPSTRPVPAPRMSKLMQTQSEEENMLDAKSTFNNNAVAYREIRIDSCDDEDDDDDDDGDDEADAVIYEELVPPSTRPPPPPPMRLISSCSSALEDDASVAGGGAVVASAEDNLYSEPEAPPPAIDNTVHSFANLLDRSNEEFIGGDESDGEGIDELSDLPDDDRNRSSLLDPRLTTIDIRHDVNKLWEKAVQELDRDEQLVEYIEKREGASSKSRSASTASNSYDSVAVPEARFRIINGVQVAVPVTLLKTFDPIFGEREEEVTTSSNSSSNSNLHQHDEEEIPPPVPSPRKRNFPTHHDILEEGDEGAEERCSTRQSSSSFEVEEVFPSIVPLPSLPEGPRPYENVWIPEEGGTPQISSASSSNGTSLASDKSDRQPPTLPRRNTNVYRGVDGATAMQTEAADESLKSYVEPINMAAAASGMHPAFRNSPRSSSTSNLAHIAKKFSFSKIGRKISEQVIKPNSPREGGVGLDRSGNGMSITSGGARSRRGSAMLETSWPGTKQHSGPLFVYSRSKKVQYGEKWCVLGNANLRYFNQRDSMADPKELILLRDILSVNRRDTSKGNEEEGDRTLFLFDVAYLSSSSSVASSTGLERGKAGKLTIRTFGASNVNTRDVWLDKLSQSLSHQLDAFSMSTGDCSKLGWVYLKVMFAGEWHQSWISLRGINGFYYTLGGDTGAAASGGVAEKVDLKKTKNVTLVKEIKNLNAPDSGVPVLVVDLIDRSLYLQSKSEKETLHWKSMLESIAFNNGPSLSEQQLTRDNIPVVVEQCVNFVFRHGCMTEGIYRHSGVKTKIDRLLEEFGKNSWAVQMTREAYSEHDVANVLKRFMRTLDEPLLTQSRRHKWMEVSQMPGEREKMRRYSSLLSELPGINRRTLRRLIGHLRTVSNQCDRNLMPNYNLAAIWGPTLLTVDGQSATGFAQTSAEADVCKDLIDNYRDLFNVTREEMEREEEIMKKTESFNRNPNPVKVSGEVMMFVHIDTKTGDDCVSIAVTPKMTAHDLQRRALKKASYAGDSTKFLLHEVILGGEMERPIHYSEVIYDVTLKWWQWAEEDRRNTYLLLKRNTFFEEAVPVAVPPLSVFGVAMFGANLKKSTFKRYLFSMNNAKITRSKESKGGLTAVEVDSWDIEKIIWYFGCESKRQAPSNLSVTFIERDQPVERTKDRPYFGSAINFPSRELFIKWVAAMLVAEHQSDIVPAETLLNIEED